ncbi:MAG: ATP-binding protein [Clostridiales bacterium]|jgi:DNA replication protein DnaC|nr:ATP-binding protein [Clostridiales bacterium]
MADAKEIQELAKILNLQNIANGTIDLNQETISNKEYLYQILLEEVNIRSVNRLKEAKKVSRLKQMIFDETKIIDGLKWQLSKIKEIDFANKKQNIFIIGECSTGKTSLASNIGMDALDRGAKVVYLTLDELLTEAKLKKGIWNNILNSDVLILDDVFYLSPTDEELIEIYKLLMFLQETRSIILITNRTLNSWKNMKVDTHLIETLAKRLLQDAQIITLA